MSYSFDANLWERNCIQMCNHCKLRSIFLTVPYYSKTSLLNKVPHRLFKTQVKVHKGQTQLINYHLQDQPVRKYYAWWHVGL